VAGVFVILQILVLGAICTVLRLHIGFYELAEALIVTSISLLYLSSVGNFTSVLFAIGVSPERVSRGAGRGIQGLIIFLYPLLISPIVGAYFARYYWNSTRAFYLLMLLAALGGVAVYSSTLPLAARLAYARREKLLEELSRGEGPIVSE
jgi:NADH:ubiquinone oxidoreductase subunit 2 (subunit N)